MVLKQTAVSPIVNSRKLATIFLPEHFSLEDAFVGKKRSRCREGAGIMRSALKIGTRFFHEEKYLIQR